MRRFVARVACAMLLARGVLAADGKDIGWDAGVGTLRRGDERAKNHGMARWAGVDRLFLGARLQVEPTHFDRPVRRQSVLDEDPATGAAAAALAGLLAERDPRPTAALQWTIRQGVEMGRPSTLHLEADKHDGRLTAVRVGGQAVLVSEGTLWV